MLLQRIIPTELLTQSSLWGAGSALEDRRGEWEDRRGEESGRTGGETGMQEGESGGKEGRGHCNKGGPGGY